MTQYFVNTNADTKRSYVRWRHTINRNLSVASVGSRTCAELPGRRSFAARAARSRMWWCRRPRRRAGRRSPRSPGTGLRHPPGRTSCGTRQTCRCTRCGGAGSVERRGELVVLERSRRTPLNSTPERKLVLLDLSWGEGSQWRQSMRNQFTAPARALPVPDGWW